jgi:thiamine biosynthesis lipoprotein
MGSVIAIEAYGRNVTHVRSAISDALDEANRLDAMLSNYKPDSEWSQMNRLAATQPVRISNELFHLLAACEEYSRESEGTFDISVGPLMKVWGFYKSSGHLPGRSEVLAALRPVGYRNVVLDSRVRTAWCRTRSRRHWEGLRGRSYGADFAERRRAHCAHLGRRQ